MNQVEHAKSLRRRLNDHAVDIEVLALEALRLFGDAGLDVEARWLGYEINGYGEEADARQLHELLRVPQGNRLAVHVAAYRVQRGAVPDDIEESPSQQLEHFFVESVRDLVAARARVRSAGVAGALELEFGPQGGIPGYPRSAEFPPDVFDRILLGLRATLHLQLGHIGE